MTRSLWTPYPDTRISPHHQHPSLSPLLLSAWTLCPLPPCRSSQQSDPSPFSLRWMMSRWRKTVMPWISNQCTVSSLTQSKTFSVGTVVVEVAKVGLPPSNQLLEEAPLPHPRRVPMARVPGVFPAPLRTLPRHLLPFWGVIGTPMAALGAATTLRRNTIICC